MKKEPIKILVAPNSMKGSISAYEFADVVEKAFLRVSDRFEIRKVPVADGGDFTGEVIRKAINARTVHAKANDPLGRTVSSKYAAAGNTAVIEMADASGLRLLKKGEPDPMESSSYGTGQLIAHAIKSGCTHILLGVGGSATVDGGAGMMQALGFSYFDAGNNPVCGNGRNLVHIAALEKTDFLAGVSFKIVTDVDNPLLGSEGAAAVFGPQKGATPAQVALLEEGLTSWCRLLEKLSGKKLSALKGAGAAGGVALPLVAFSDGEIVQGARYILSLLNFDEHVEWADIVITGEGKIDLQTLNNKAPHAVADWSRKAGKTVIAIGGTVEHEAAEIFSGGAYSFLNKPVTLDEAMLHPNDFLYFFSSQLAKTILSFYGSSKRL